MLPSLVSTKYGRYKVNQDDLATFLAVTGTLYRAPTSLTRPKGCSSGLKSTRLKGKYRKVAKQQAADEATDATTRQKPPKLELNNYVPLAEIIAKSSSVHSRVPPWVIGIIEKIIQDRQDCFEHINDEDVATFLSRGQYDGHIHPINVLEKVRSILVLKYEKQVAVAQKDALPRTPAKRNMGKISGNAFAELKIDSPEKSPSSTGRSDAQAEGVEIQDQAQADVWRKSLRTSQVFAAYPEASHEEALVALGSLRKDMDSIREVVRDAWTEYMKGTVDLAAAAVTTNTGIDLARSLESQARPVIESYMRSRDAKDIELPVYFYSLGDWVRDLNGKTCGTNIYAALLGSDPPDQVYMPPELQVDPKKPGYPKSAHFLWAYKLVQLYCMEFFSKTKELKMPPHHEPRRWGKGDRPDDAKLLEFARTLGGKDIQWIYELAWLGNYGYGPIFPIVDEVSRGFRVMHEDADLKLWAVFAVQMFHEINLMIKPDGQIRALHSVSSFLRHGFLIFRKAEESYSAVYNKKFHGGKDEPNEKDTPQWRARAGKTVFTCLFPARVDKEIESVARPQYPNLHQFYLMSQHPILCGILLHTGRLVMQELGIAVENCTRPILKMAHLYNACCSEHLVDAPWLDLEYCMMLQSPNLFMNGEAPEKSGGYGKAYLLVTGALSLTYTAPDCRDDPRNGGRSAWDDKPIKGRKNNAGKTLQKLGKVSLMFEERFCRTGERYDLNEDDIRALAEQAASYTPSGNDEGRSEAQSKTSRSAAKKTKSLDEVLRDLCRGLNHEVPMITFPYISLNVDCSDILWYLETQVQFKHHLLCDLDTAPAGLGQIAMSFLVNHSDRLSIPADIINKHTEESACGGNDGMSGLLWVFRTVPEPLRARYPEEVQEYYSNKPCKKAGRSRPVREGTSERQDGPPLVPGGEILVQLNIPMTAMDPGEWERPVNPQADESKPKFKIIYQSHRERED